MGMGEKTQNTTKRKTKQRKKKFSPFGCPHIPSSTKWRPTVFRCPKTLKTSRTNFRWERDPNLMGQNLLNRLRMSEESSSCKESNELWQDLQEQLLMSEDSSSFKKKYEYVGQVDGNLVQKAICGPDILRPMERDKRFSLRILDHGSVFCSRSSRTRKKQIHQEGIIYQPLRSDRIWHKVNF